jgi:hypothetical protein
VPVVETLIENFTVEETTPQAHPTIAPVEAQPETAETIETTESQAADTEVDDTGRYRRY